MLLALYADALHYLSVDVLAARFPGISSKSEDDSAWGDRVCPAHTREVWVSTAASASNIQFIPPRLLPCIKDVLDRYFLTHV